MREFNSEQVVKGIGKEVNFGKRKNKKEWDNYKGLLALSINSITYFFLVYLLLILSDFTVVGLSGRRKDTLIFASSKQ